MSDLAANVTWQEILREDIPHCRAIAAPSRWHDEIIQALARITLGDFRPTHPDLLITGSIDKAPDINSCRSLIQDIALKPLESTRRLGVIMSADKLLLPAANSLLKLAEEPPVHACLLFLMEDGRFFLPTLRSRSRYSVLVFHEERTAKSMPRSDLEWIEWLTNSRRNPSDISAVTKDLDEWANGAIDAKNFTLAERIERVKIIADKKNLSMPLLCDFVLLSLREEYICTDKFLPDI